jgi:hypothetical protein
MKGCIAVRFRNGELEMTEVRHLYQASEQQCRISGIKRVVDHSGLVVLLDDDLSAIMLAPPRPCNKK